MRGAPLAGAPKKKAGFKILAGAPKKKAGLKILAGGSPCLNHVLCGSQPPSGAVAASYAVRLDGLNGS